MSGRMPFVSLPPRMANTVSCVGAGRFVESAHRQQCNHSEPWLGVFLTVDQQAEYRFGHQVGRVGRGDILLAAVLDGTDRLQFDGVNTWDCYCLCFSGPSLEKMLIDFGFREALLNVSLTECELQEFSQRFELLNTFVRVESDSMKLWFQSRALGVLMDLLVATVTRNSAKPAEGRHDVILAELASLLEREPDAPDAVNQVAQNLGYSVGHFSRLVRQLTGYSPKRYLIRERIRQACFLLSQTSLTVTEVGRRVGYGDRRHFSTLFRRETGMSPGQWRRQRRRPVCVP